MASMTPIMIGRREGSEDEGPPGGGGGTGGQAVGGSYLRNRRRRRAGGGEGGWLGGPGGGGGGGGGSYGTPQPPQFQDITTSDPAIAAEIGGWEGVTQQMKEASISDLRAALGGQEKEIEAQMARGGLEGMPAMSKAGLQRQYAQGAGKISRDIGLERQQQKIGATFEAGRAAREERESALSAYDRQLRAWEAAQEAMREQERNQYAQLEAYLRTLSTALG